MALQSALNGQLMLAIETTFGVPVTPTVALPIVDESLTSDVERMESAAQIKGNMFLTSEQWAPGNVTAGGDIGLELFRRSLGKVFRLIFGQVATTGPVSSLYTHTFTPLPLTGLSATIQKGVPDVTDGTVHPLTYAGCKIASAQIAVKEGEIATLGLTVIAKQEHGFRTFADGATTNGQATLTSPALALFSQYDVGTPVSGTGIPVGAYILSVTSPTTATMSANASATGSGVTVTMGVALATPTYAVGLGVPFNFAQGFVAVGGSQVKVKACTIDIDLGLADDRRFVGQPTVSEQLEKQLREVTGTLDLEWVNRTQYDRFCKASESSLWLSLSAGSDTCNITSNVRFDGETPQMSGGDIVQQSVPFKAIQSSTAASALQAVLVNSDTVA